MKLINARIANLESNLHIEIDMERIEDRSKSIKLHRNRNCRCVKGNTCTSRRENNTRSRSSSNRK